MKDIFFIWIFIIEPIIWRLQFRVVEWKSRKYLAKMYYHYSTTINLKLVKVSWAVGLIIEILIQTFPKKKSYSFSRFRVIGVAAVIV